MHSQKTRQTAEDPGLGARTRGYAVWKGGAREREAVASRRERDGGAKESDGAGVGGGGEGRRRRGEADEDTVEAVKRGKEREPDTGV